MDFIIDDVLTRHNQSLSCLDLINGSFMDPCIATGLPLDHVADPEPYSPLAVTLLSIFLGLMTVCGAVGNVLVILSVALTRKLRTVTNCFIVSLAVADLLVAVFVMPISAFVEVTGEWWFGSLVCWIFISADVFLCTSSIWNLLIISLERCMAISWPLWYGARRTRRLALYLIAVAWIVSMIICLPPLMLQGMLEGSMENGHCSYAIDEGYRIYSASGSFWIPLAIILFCYVRIFYVANRKDKLLEKAKGANNHVNSNGTTTAVVMKDGSDAKRPSNPSSESQDLLTFRQLMTPSSGGGACGSPTTTMRHTVLVRASSITETHLDSTMSLIEIRMDGWSGPTSSLSRTSSGATVKLTPNGTATNHVGNGPAIIHPSKKTNSSSTTATRSGHRRIRRAMTARLSGAVMMTGGGGARGSASSASTRMPGKQLSFKDRERKVFRVLLIILCSFVACWAGFFVIYTLEPFCAACKEIDKRVYAFFLWLGYFNSMLNPLIYAGFSKDFRQAFLAILCCRCSVGDVRARRKRLAAGGGGIRPRCRVVSP
ncbi:putative 5-hydroxytryptamine receptor 1A [Hypsibius exemplaris]|uniref:5-hydroxytryptamine receptor 1A n=1 Tax=Hypsibius exemplaris TaxID=2072580 RepID=A0A1W0WMA3_HYPEX|nr:putative 5-hydroxytryptamine receptor 1A [Hypsibius exemplaris]